MIDLVLQRKVWRIKSPYYEKFEKKTKNIVPGAGFEPALSYDNRILLTTIVFTTIGCLATFVCGLDYAFTILL